ncbi:putative F-box domain-containing protein [Medicago truncatula]|uniref:F-box protein interaction domain protein n=1 Tax=Medicago truncatula TaxID=3880 RepID=A0A072TE84_MEDTR|nr:putative F-box protein At3g16210 [Medicago truncatula]KEH15551.1 F-box protein interaction domain protein [Medicago truncatula]RHN78723.1 putative F-box domain-containing protein [Medicago truncatula]
MLSIYYLLVYIVIVSISAFLLLREFTSTWRSLRKKYTASNNYKVSSSNYVPDDVSFVIFSKLPLKSLKRFTCACKSWSLLFEDPHFMKMFRNNFIFMHRSLYNDTCLFLNIKEILPYDQHGSTLYFLSDEKFENRVKLEDDSTYTHLLDSGINGILCLSDFYHEYIKLWNPATKELKFVPPSPVQFLFYKCFSFDIHGFGYDHVNNDYKIVRHVNISYYQPNDSVDWTYLPTTPRSFWEIYSVKCNSWKRLHLEMPTYEGYFKVYLSGLCHWCVGEDYDVTSMVSFNLSNEVFCTTLLPLYTKGNYSDNWVHLYTNLVVINEFVSIIFEHVKTTYFHIYVLGEPGVSESWTKLFIVGPLPSVERPIGVRKNGDILLIRNENELACFDLITQTIEDLGVKVNHLYCDLAIYKKNLLPIGQIKK